MLSNKYIQLEMNFLPSIAHQQDGLSKTECTAYQHGKPPHALGPDHMTKLLRHASNAGHKWTCQSHIHTHPVVMDGKQNLTSTNDQLCIHLTQETMTTQLVSFFYCANK